MSQPLHAGNHSWQILPAYGQSPSVAARLPDPASAQVPVCECGAALAFDSGELCWRRWMPGATMDNVASNSLYQFHIDSNQNCSLQVLTQQDQRLRFSKPGDMFSTAHFIHQDH